MGVYLVSSLAGVPFSAVCLAPQPVFHGQVYRLLTSALSHAGLLHLGMNMAALLVRGMGRRAGRHAAQ